VAVRGAGYFSHTHKDRNFERCSTNKAPIRSHDHEHPESPKGDLPVEELEKICKALGCIAFTSTTGRLFVRLPEKAEWIDAEGEDVYEIKDLSPPWHHVDINYHFEAMNINFNSFSYDITFNQDVGKDINIYLCTFGGNMNTGHFYGGFQTNVGCPANHGQEAVHRDKGVIFSRWGRSQPSDVVKAEGSFLECATYEGAFASIRRHLNWTKGRYTVKLEKTAETEEGTWVSFSVQHSGINVEVGKLFFRGQKPLQLGKWMYSFVEIYGREKVYVSSKLPTFTMTMSNMKVNGSVVEPSVEVSYWKESPLYADVYKESGREDWHVVVHFGAPFFVSEYPVMRLY